MTLPSEGITGRVAPPKAFPFGEGGTAIGTSEPMAVTDEVEMCRFSEM